MRKDGNGYGFGLGYADGFWDGSGVGFESPSDVLIELSSLELLYYLVALP